MSSLSNPERAAEVFSHRGRSLFRKTRAQTVSFLVSTPPVFLSRFGAPCWRLDVARCCLSRLRQYHPSLIHQPVTLVWQQRQGCAGVKSEEGSSSYRVARGSRGMKTAEISVRIDPGREVARASVYTCDYAFDYVNINADDQSQ